MFKHVDFAAINQTPVAQFQASNPAPIQHLIDTASSTYHVPADTGCYPLITQLTSRHSDHLFPKLVAGG